MPKSRRTPARPSFRPVATRARHDGWTPEKQVRFVEALAESGCVTEACAAVAMSKQSAYALRMRTDAQGFRMAWDAALDLAIRRLSDECFSRAMHGEAVPHFYKGEQVGEHRRYDNRLAQLLLRYRDPLRYAATLDQMVYAGHPETAAVAFAKLRERVRDEAHGERPSGDAGHGRPPFDATPVRDELARQRDEALVEGDAPVFGSTERRRDILARRAARYAAPGGPSLADPFTLGEPVAPATRRPTDPTIAAMADLCGIDLRRQPDWQPPDWAWAEAAALSTPDVPSSSSTSAARIRPEPRVRLC